MFLFAGLFAVVSFFWTYPMYVEYTGRESAVKQFCIVLAADNDTG